jgi:hypothetical protein
LLLSLLLRLALLLLLALLQVVAAAAWRFLTCSAKPHMPST